MHKPVAVLAAGGIVIAVAAAVFGLWIPARHQRQDAAWTAAGQRALAHVVLPSRYSASTGDGRIRPCSSGVTERCYLGSGDPTAQVATVEAALAAVATGPVKASCSPVTNPGSPDSCNLVVPVAGSRLVAELFAHPRSRSGPLSQWTYAGSYLLIHLDGR